MKIKKVDNVFDVCLWGIFVILIIGSWFFTKSISAPNFEIVQSDIKFPYEYTSEDGNIVKSAYYLAWKHEQFSKPKIVVYDPSTKQWNTIKDEYLEEYKAQMPKSKYAFWQHCFWVVFAFGVIISALGTYFIGGWIRDFILYAIVRKHNSFSDCSYFLYHDRMCFNSQVKNILSTTIDDYILTKKNYLYQKYVPSFADLVIKLLLEIKVQQDTKVRFFYSYLDNTKRHLDYLKDLSLYWQSQIGKVVDASNKQEYVDILRQKDYVDFNLKMTASDLVDIVSSELKDLFTEVMGEEVFNFEAYRSEYADVVKTPGAIFVTTTVENSLYTFTWSGTSFAGKVFPGIAVRFTIYHYQNREKIILWDRYLNPKCTYKAEDKSLIISDLYENMIKETIRSFPESLKKNNNKS